MLFSLMKGITWFLSPLALALAGVLLGGYWVWRDHLRRGLWALALSVAWLWVWASPWFFILIGGALERAYPPAKPESLPSADAIVVLGGGIKPPTRLTREADLDAAADRGWHAARCYHAGRAPLVLFSGVGEGPGMRQFLMDLGVPAKKIIMETDSKNTYQNGQFTREKLKALKAKRVILVTSAWHMRRSLLVFKHMGVEAIPAATDYEALTASGLLPPSRPAYYLPTADCLDKSTAVQKEVLGYWAYRAYLLIHKDAGGASPIHLLGRGHRYRYRPPCKSIAKAHSGLASILYVYGTGTRTRKTRGNTLIFLDFLWTVSVA